MKVTLINHTQSAEDLLIFTKQTRLQMSPSLMNDIQGWSYQKRREELEYISNTIKSSWEFIDYTFLIEGVTRAFTHQFVRNRQGSYAQQTMRILDVSGFTYHTGPTIDEDSEMKEIYNCGMDAIQEGYDELIRSGVAIEDARGLLPTNIHTNIIAKYNLRTMSDLVASRSSPRTQGEFREVMEQMYQCIIEVHPWAVNFLKDKKVDAASELDKFIEANTTSPTEKMQLIKLVDLLRK